MRLPISPPMRHGSPWADAGLPPARRPSQSRGPTMPARFTLSFAALLAFAAAGEPARAHDYKAGALTISHPWIRATPKGAAVAGGFLTVTNTGATPDRLVGGSVTGASRAEIHATSTEGGV